MRRSIFALLGAALASMGTVGCEDGPNQNYSPTSPNAAANQNGGPGSAVDPATKDFGYLHGGTNANVLCDGPTLHKVWGMMDNQPILPPTSIGGVNMAGPDCNATSCSWNGLTIEQAEKVLCQGNNAGDLFGDGSLNTCWGDSNEVCAHYSVTTHKINFMNIDLLGVPGYNGALNLKGCAGTASEGHSYVIGAFTQMQRDGNNWEVDWNSAKVAGDWRNEFTSALMCTFSGLPKDPDCNSSGRCIQGNFGDVGYLYVPVLGAAIWVANQNAAQPQPSIMYRIDVYLSKVTPFALDTPYLKFDAEGPTATSATPLGKNTTPCVLKMGMTYGDFLKQCVQVSGNAAQDQSELNKLLGGISHTTERFAFNVSGVDVNFSDSHLAVDAIVKDSDLPQNDDPAGSFNVDQDTLGALAQDLPNNDPTQTKKDLHGTGIVYLQWARRVERAISALLVAKDPATPVRYIGDPACMGANAFANAGAGATKGCTGFEEIVTPMPARFIGAATLAAEPNIVAATLPDGTDVTAKSMPQVIANMLLGLKPGHQKTAFCDDHSNVPQSYANCDANSLDVPTSQWTAGEGDTFQTGYQRVFKVLGGSKVSRLPSEVQDVRFYFKEWGQALIQYMKAEGAAASGGSTDGSTVTLDAVDAQVVDGYNLFFDSIGAGQFEQMEYVERSFTNMSTPPLDFVFEADVRNGIQDAYHFDRYLYRDEKALYTAMIDGRDNAAHAPGSQDTTLLTNVFGSPVLHSGWKDHTKDTCTGCGGPKYTPFYCATHNDPIPCGNQVAPLACSLNAGKTCITDADCAPSGAGTCIVAVDQFGQPMLAPYEGAFLNNATAFTLGGGASPSVAVPITQVYGKGDTAAMDGTYPDIQQVMIQIPLHQNPYDMTSAPPNGGAPSAQVLTDWNPKQPGIGFPVALTGTRDRFIETYQMDLSGDQVTANVDYDFQLDTHMQPTQQILFMAVETTDFLGDLFVCQDSATHDLLTARMYTSVQSILDWFAAHPNAYNACQIITRYSPYGNYADYITSLQNGVRLSVTQGGGFGRIVDGTLFDPTLPQN
jgi:hypothetical protein